MTDAPNVAARPRGRLLLIPNTLDFGAPASCALPPLDDVLPRGVIRTAAGLRHWACENAKTTRAFLKRVDAVIPLAVPLQSLDLKELPRPPKGGDRSGAKSAQGAVVSPDPWAALLAPALRGDDVGLISEAGLPAVADPGARLVRLAHDLGVPVVSMSGPSSLMLALASSGLEGQRFAFHGYLPIDAVSRDQRIKDLEATSRRLDQSQLVIETPYRNPALLSALVATLAPSTRLAVSCGLSLDEGFTRSGTVADWRQRPMVVPTVLPAVFSLLAPG